MRLEYRHLQWMEFVWDAALTTKAKIVASYLARCMNKDHHVAWPSLETLAGKTGLSRRSVIYALDELEGQGWITKDVGGPGLGSNRYYAVFPKPVEAALTSASAALSGATTAPGGATTAPDLVQQLHPNQSNRISPKNRVTRKQFVPPSLDEVRAYVRDNRLQVDPDWFYQYFTAGNWHDSSGKAVLSWKQKLITHSNSNKQHGRPGKSIDNDLRGML